MAVAALAESPMTSPPTGLDPLVARCRLILSAIAIIAVYVDPTEPTLLPWIQLTGGAFTIDPGALFVLGGHFLYSLAVYALLARGPVPATRLAPFTTWGDVIFGAVIVLFTEGTSSPFWAFFVFAVIAAGAHGGLRRSLAVTTVSVAIYLSLIVIAWHGETNFYLMRPVYLAVVGYLTAYLGQQRLNLETEVHHLEKTRERNRIARALHDGSVQTLGGTNLALQTCRELVLAGRKDEALAMLGELQRSIAREYDELRAWVRELAEVEPAQAPIRPQPLDTRFTVRVEFSGSAGLVDHVLQIVREAVANVKRHARARTAVVNVRTTDGQVFIAIDDDGQGFSNPEQVPWSISSRVQEAGGELRIARDARPGAHLRLALPEA
jgi:signal transduction histidine kinase